MDLLREYLLRVTAAAILCGVLSSIVGKKGAAGATIKFLCGIFLTLTLVGPWVKIRWDGLLDFSDDIRLEADSIRESGEAASYDACAAIIKEKTAAYILDKAVSYGGELAVDVTLDESFPPAPCAVTIGGAISPYGKRVLSGWIEQELGIPQEAQIWTR